MTPTRYRAGGADTEMRFAVGECSLGSILVAQSERGVCAIMMGDDPDALARELQDQFPRAKLIGGDAGFEQLVAKVVGLVEAPGVGLDLPLDVRGTAFQQRVWQALREVPAGQTVSYTDIARLSALPKRYGPWRRHVRQTSWQSLFPVIAWCAMTAPWPVMAGVLSASARFSKGSRVRERKRRRIRRRGRACRHEYIDDRKSTGNHPSQKYCPAKWMGLTGAYYLTSWTPRDVRSSKSS